MRPDRDRLSELLTYNTDTGVLKWRNPRSGARGCAVGSVNKSHGYREVTVDYVKYRAHRVAWFMAYNDWPEEEVDHINGRRDDNRIQNLRVANRRDNCLNTDKHRGGHLAGTTKTRSGTWRAQIMVNGVHHHLGTFWSQEAAHNAYQAARLRLGV